MLRASSHILPAETRFSQFGILRSRLGQGERRHRLFAKHSSECRQQLLERTEPLTFEREGCQRSRQIFAEDGIGHTTLRLRETRPALLERRAGGSARGERTCDDNGIYGAVNDDGDEEVMKARVRSEQGALASHDLLEATVVVKASQRLRPVLHFDFDHARNGVEGDPITLTESRH